MTFFFLLRCLDPGGAERQLCVLASGLVARGHRIVVAPFYGGGSLAAELRAAGAEVEPLGKGGRWSFGFLVRLIRLIRRERPAVLHSYLVVPNLVAALLKPLFPSPPVVWGIRASQMNLERFDLMARWSFRLERLAAHLPDLIIYNSYAGRAYHEALGYPPQRAAVVSNGIDTARFRPLPEARRSMRRTWGIPANAPLVGLPARLDPVKGHDVFLRAVAVLAVTRPDVRFVCIGGGDVGLGVCLRRQAESLGVAERVIWTGHCDDMPAAYAALDLACLPSLGEGFPNVVAEAMACGVPCVVSAVGDAADLVRGIGVTVPPSDAEALAAGLADLLLRAGDPDLRAAGRRRIVENYGSAVLAERTLDALRPLLERP